MMTDLNKNNLFDEFALFQRITSGDEDAFRRIVHYYSPKLIAFLYNITKTNTAAEEILQEVFLRLWQKRESIKMDNPGGWLFRVATNLAYSYLKKEALNGRLLNYVEKNQQFHYSEIDQLMDYKECRRLINNALFKLPKQQRKICFLSLQEGLSRNEIARLLNISPNTVKNHLYRALQFLKHSLSKANIFLFFFFI